MIILKMFSEVQSFMEIIKSFDEKVMKRPLIVKGYFVSIFPSLMACITFAGARCAIYSSFIKSI